MTFDPNTRSRRIGRNTPCRTASDQRAAEVLRYRLAPARLLEAPWITRSRSKSRQQGCADLTPVIPIGVRALAHLKVGASTFSFHPDYMRAERQVCQQGDEPLVFAARLRALA